MPLCLKPLPLTGWKSPWFRVYEASHMPLGRNPSKIDQNPSVMPILEWVDFGHFQYWRTWVQIPGSTFLQNFHSKNTRQLMTSNEGGWPIFRSIRSIGQEILNFKILKIFQKSEKLLSASLNFFGFHSIESGFPTIELSDHNSEKLGCTKYQVHNR